LPGGLSPLKVQGYIVGELYASVESIGRDYLYSDSSNAPTFLVEGQRLTLAEANTILDTYEAQSIELDNRLATMEDNLGATLETLKDNLSRVDQKSGFESLLGEALTFDGKTASKEALNDIRVEARSLGQAVRGLRELIKQENNTVVGDYLEDLKKSAGSLTQAVHTAEGRLTVLEASAQKLKVGFTTLGLVAGNMKDGKLNVTQQGILAVGYGRVLEGLRGLGRSGLVEPGTFQQLSRTYTGAQLLANKLKGQVDLAGYRRQSQAERNVHNYDGMGPIKAGALKIWHGINDTVEADIRMQVHFAEDVHAEAAKPNADMATKLVAALMPQNVYQRIYKNVEENEDKYDTGVVYATAFFTGISAVAIETSLWAAPALSLARMTPVMAQAGTETAFEFFGADEKNATVAGAVAAKLTMAGTVALGGVTNLRQQAELYLAKTAGFAVAAEGIDYAAETLVATYSLGGGDKAGAKQDISDALWILGGHGLGKVSERKVAGYEREGKRAQTEIKEATREIARLERSKEPFLRELTRASVKMEEGKIKLKNAELNLKIEKGDRHGRFGQGKGVLGQENGGFGQGVGRLVDRGSGGSTEQRGAFRGLLQEVEGSRGRARKVVERVQRTESTVQRTESTVQRTESTVQRTESRVQRAESRKQFIIEEIRRLDSGIKTENSRRRSAEKREQIAALKEAAWWPGKIMVDGDTPRGVEQVISQALKKSEERRREPPILRSANQIADDAFEGRRHTLGETLPDGRKSGVASGAMLTDALFTLGLSALAGAGGWQVKDNVLNPVPTITNWTTTITQSAAEKTVQVGSAVKDAAVSAANKAVDWTATTTRGAADKVLNGVESSCYAIREFGGKLEENTVQSLAAIQMADGWGPTTRAVVGLVTSNVSGDALDRQPSLTLDPKRPTVFINGIFTTNDYARNEVRQIAKEKGLTAVAVVRNNTHFILGDILQIVGHEFGAHDITAIRARNAMREAIQKHGIVYVESHSQGSASADGGISMLTSAERSRVVYKGDGPQKYIDREKYGLKAATNIRYPKDPMPTVNDVLKYVGLRSWKQDWVVLERQPETEDWIGHNYLVNYLNGKRPEEKR
jgi:hypothetical protein